LIAKARFRKEPGFFAWARIIDGLVAGRLWSAAERRVDKAGKSYTVARLRVTGVDIEGVLVNLIAFDPQVCECLHDAQEGEAVSVSGALTPKVWTDKQGNTKPALDMVVHRVLMVRAD
jgi:single-stranded DNA-binding protein